MSIKPTLSQAFDSRRIGAVNIKRVDIRMVGRGCVLHKVCQSIEKEEMKEIFKAGIQYGYIVEVRGGYLCLLTHDYREVMYVKINEEMIAEAKEAYKKFDYQSIDLALAMNEIVTSRVHEFTTIQEPVDYLEAYLANARDWPHDTAPAICESFDSFRADYEKYWDAIDSCEVGTPWDEEPSEEYLRAEWPVLKEEFQKFL